MGVCRCYLGEGDEPLSTSATDTFCLDTSFQVSSIQVPMMVSFDIPTACSDTNCYVFLLEKRRCNVDSQSLSRLKLLLLFVWRETLRGLGCSLVSCKLIVFIDRLFLLQSFLCGGCAPTWLPGLGYPDPGWGLATPITPK